jgi:hypothetical protein
LLLCGSSLNLLLFLPLDAWGYLSFLHHTAWVSGCLSYPILSYPGLSRVFLVLVLSF